MPKRPVQFDTLLRIRQVQQTLRAHDLATARREIAAAERQRADLVQERLSLFDEAGRRARDRFDAREIRAYYQYERYLSRRIDDQDSELRRLEGIAAERRIALEEAMKRRRMVDKLRERKMDVYMHEVRKDEQKLSDEKATGSAAVARAQQRARP